MSEYDDDDDDDDDDVVENQILFNMSKWFYTHYL